jgi:ferrous iron transport protein A
MSVDLMFLSMIQPGQKVRLVTVQAGRGLKARLAEMGLVPGVELEVINRNSAGPFIVAVKQSRIMLGRGMAHRIVVS